MPNYQPLPLALSGVAVEPCGALKTLHGRTDTITIPALTDFVPELLVGLNESRNLWSFMALILRTDMMSRYLQGGHSEVLKSLAV